jgi:hypothetical protein
MKTIVFMLMGTLIFLGCKKNQSSSRTEMNEEEFHEFNEIKNQEMEGRVNYNLYTPCPIDIQYTVVLASRWLSDIDMMLG